MNVSLTKSSFHHPHTRRLFKKLLRNKDAGNSTAKVESGFGKLQIGKEALGVQAAYKSIFHL